MSASRGLEDAPPVVELRQYLLHRDRREELIDLFDREFIETQEANGIRVIGQFRDIDRPNHFVWLRGFHDHSARRDALTAFYDGPVWAEHGPTAGATMIDSDDVHQLRPGPRPGSQLRIRSTTDRDIDGDKGVALIVIAHRPTGHEFNVDDLVQRIVIPRIEAVGFTTSGNYENDPAENAFPRLPVRRSNVAVWIATSDDLDHLDAAAHELSVARLELTDHIGSTVADEIQLDVLRLVPTTRSCLTHR